MYYENSVNLIGCLGRDPEIRSFNNGGKVANLRVATTETWKDRTTGEKKERTEWHSVTVTGDGLVGVVERYIKKGSYVRVTGQLRTRKWQDQSGQDRYSTEVVVSGFGGKVGMLDRQGGPGGGSGGGYGGGDDGAPQGSGQSGGPGQSRDIDDEIPF